MRILLDTNIFIPLEDSSIDIDDAIAELNRLASSKHQLLVHPGTAIDLCRDKNEDRKQKILARLNKYSQLESAPIFLEGEEESLLGSPKKDNDSIDNLILLAVYKNCVHWLITQDEGIHKKAKRIGAQERVLTVDQAITVLAKVEYPALKLYPSIKDVPCHSLNLKNPFFDSLREAYDGFDGWFVEKCSKTGRKAWVCANDNEIHAICIYNIERDPIVTVENKGLPGEALKLCTFKVLKRGYKIGELLLKQAFSYAVKNNIDCIYVTVEPHKHGLLEELFYDFGFDLYGIDCKGRDNVFVKTFPKFFQNNDLGSLEYAIRFFPKIKISNSSVYLVPIKPHYHDILFPEISRQNDLFRDDISSAGNTIKKAYLCNSNSSSIKAGDVLFFYRTEDEKSITSYGIVDQFYIENDPDKIFQWVSKRTVYSFSEIQNMRGKKTKIILFRQVDHLQNYINFNKLKSMNIVSGPIQSITKISKQKTVDIINEANLGGCILSD
jgi:rRNA-processing protein FCF1